MVSSCRNNGTISQELRYPFTGTVVQFWQESSPLSLLLGYGEKAKPGEWLGDAIGVSNQRPEGFFRIPRIYLKYYPYYHNSCTLSRRMVRRMPKSKESIAVYQAKIEEMTR